MEKSRFSRNCTKMRWESKRTRWKRVNERRDKSHTIEGKITANCSYIEFHCLYDGFAFLPTLSAKYRSLCVKRRKQKNRKKKQNAQHTKFALYKNVLKSIYWRMEFILSFMHMCLTSLYLRLNCFSSHFFVLLLLLLPDSSISISAKFRLLNKNKYPS